MERMRPELEKLQKQYANNKELYRDLAKAYEEDVIIGVSSIFEKINEYGISSSPLTPSLYVIPENVEKLKIAYESVLLMNYENDGINSRKELFIEEVLRYFSNYDASDTIENDAAELLKKYDKLNEYILNSSKPNGIVKVIGHVFSFKNINFI